MRPEDYKPRDKVIPVAKGSIKKSPGRKLSEVFLAEDISNVKSYIVFDVLLPSVKKALYDIISNGLHMILWGGTKKINDSSGTPYISYADYSNSGDRFATKYSTQRVVPSRNLNYNSVSFPSMEDAVSAKKQLVSIINKYGFTTVSELYEMASLTAPYTANHYGWTKSNINNVMNADIIDANGNWFIRLPKPEYIEQ